MSSYRFSAAANIDIEEITLYLLELNPVAANKFVRALDEKCQLLAKLPHIGKTRNELQVGLRSFPIGNYLVFYYLGVDGIDVARIIYGGRDLERIYRS